MASKQKIAAVIGVLCEAFNRQPTAATYKAYEIALQDVPDELLDQAGNAALTSTASFMPTPGQLRAMAVTGGISYESRAERAWMEFDKAVGHHGADHSVSFDDGLINATVRLIGDWVWCCERTGDDYTVWLRKAFIETYSRLCVSGATESLRQPLMGRLWRENAMFGPEHFKNLSENVNTGQVVTVATSQPVLLPPTDAPKRVERAADVPQLQLKRVSE